LEPWLSGPGWRAASGCCRGVGKGEPLTANGVALSDSDDMEELRLHPVYSFRFQHRRALPGSRQGHHAQVGARAIHQRSGRSFPWLLQAYRLHASQSAASRARANPVEPSRTNPPMAKLAVIEPVESSRTQPREIEQKNK
jgi:hypothetical protein